MPFALNLINQLFCSGTNPAFSNYPYSPIECIDKVLKEMGTLQVLSTQWDLACIFGTLPNSLNY